MKSARIPMLIAAHVAGKCAALRAIGGVHGGCREVEFGTVRFDESANSRCFKWFRPFNEAAR
jgi:hypothetical protein